MVVKSLDEIHVQRKQGMRFTYRREIKMFEKLHRTVFGNAPYRLYIVASFKEDPRDGRIINKLK